MPAEKKLYRVDVRFSYFAMAKSERDATMFADNVLDNEYMPDCGYATEVQYSNDLLPHGWENDSLVYHSGSEDLYLGELLEKLPKRGT